MTARPYGTAAFKYRTASWKVPLPATKKTPPEGFTGWEHADTWPDDDQIAAWVRTSGRRNITLRLHREMVGLDVDAWKGESFVETMKAISAAHGILPRTWVSNSRSDSSGIRLFRLPFETKQGELAGNIKHPDGGDRIAGEVIHHGHRTAVVWPSIHPVTGEPYRWIYQSTGEISAGYLGRQSCRCLRRRGSITSAVSAHVSPGRFGPLNQRTR